MTGPSHSRRVAVASLLRVSIQQRKPMDCRKWLPCPSRSEVRRSGPHRPIFLLLTHLFPLKRRRTDQRPNRQTLRWVIHAILDIIPVSHVLPKTQIITPNMSFLIAGIIFYLRLAALSSTISSFSSPSGHLLLLIFPLSLSLSLSLSLTHTHTHTQPLGGMKEIYGYRKTVGHTSHKEN